MLETESPDPVAPPLATAVTSSPATANTSSQSDVPAAQRHGARMHLEADSLDLICQFEAMLSEAEKQRLDGYIAEIVAIVDKSLQTALEFGETHFCGQPLEVLKKRVREARECSQSLASAVSSYEWKSLRRIIGRESASELDVLKIHGKLGTAVAMVVVTTLGPAIEMLGSKNKTQSEMLRIVKLFVAELSDRW